MLVRIWRTEIDPEKVEAFEAFARRRSLPMLKDQTGCLGVFLARNGSDAATITLWDDQKSIDQLAHSPSYQDTVRQIEQTGYLQGKQSVRVYPVFSGSLDHNNLAPHFDAPAG